MIRSARVVFCGALVLALAVPALAEAQAGRRRGTKVVVGQGRRGPGGIRGGMLRGRGLRSRGVRRPVDRASRSAPEVAMGSIRLKASPDTAMVYVDGAVAGRVSEFDGLTNHLKLSTGAHAIELRADGYETYRSEINVAAGKTLTERMTLKKIK